MFFFNVLYIIPFLLSFFYLRNFFFVYPYFSFSFSVIFAWSHSYFPSIHLSLWNILFTFFIHWFYHHSNTGILLSSSLFIFRPPFCFSFLHSFTLHASVYFASYLSWSSFTSFLWIWYSFCYSSTAPYCHKHLQFLPADLWSFLRRENI